MTTPSTKANQANTPGTQSSSLDVNLSHLNITHSPSLRTKSAEDRRLQEERLRRFSSDKSGDSLVRRLWGENGAPVPAQPPSHQGGKATKDRLK